MCLFALTYSNQHYFSFLFYSVDGNGIGKLIHQYFNKYLISGEG